MNFGVIGMKSIILVMVIDLLIMGVNSENFRKLYRKRRDVTVHPEIDLNTTQVIRLHNYTAEEHSIMTEDGYFITLHRIPFGKNPSNTSRYPVLIVHGVSCTSETWVDNTPNKSLAFILADEGYDVWLGNVRGNHYAQKHHNLSITDFDFWDFSFYQHGVYDLSAMIDGVLNKTGYSDLFYIGHSMGTTIAFVLLSEKPEYNNKVKGFMALAPVAYVTQALPDYQNYFYIFKFIKRIFKTFGINRLTPSDEVHSYYVKAFCRNKYKPKVCQNIFFALAGGDSNLLDKERVPLYISHCSHGSSLNVLDHYMQIRESERFARFDYGEKRNKIYYGMKEPPLFKLSKITAPVALFWSLSDPLATPKDVSRLRKELKNLVLDYQVEYKSFTHADFVWAKNARKLVYNEMLSVMETILNSNSTNDD